MPQPMELRELPDGRTGFLDYCLGNLISNQYDRYTSALTAAVNLEDDQKRRDRQGHGFRCAVRSGAQYCSAIAQCESGTSTVVPRPPSRPPYAQHFRREGGTLSPAERAA